MQTWGISAAARFASPGSALVLPALLLNYLGQGALLLAHPDRGAVTVLSDGAVVGAVPAGRVGDDGRGDRVAGAHLGRVLADAPGRAARILSRVSTSTTPRSRERGQIYIPQVNWMLMMATVGARHRASAARAPLPPPMASP